MILMMIRRTIFAIGIVVGFGNNAFAQSSDLGSWNIANIRYHFDDKWSLFGEAQVRSLEFYNHFYYYEYKGGATYKIDKNTAVSLAAGSYQTYQDGGNFVLPKRNDEFRIWPQLIMNQSIGKLKIEQRYRAEFRFTSNGYRNRFRYRLSIAYPFGKAKDKYQPYQISLSDELFFSDNAPFFERNRFAFSFGYKPSRTIMLQAGYLHQFDYKIDNEIGRDFLQITFSTELFRKQPTATTK